MLRAGHPVGVITGGGCGAARTQEPHLADRFFARRRCPQWTWQGAGTPAQGPDGVEKGFAGAAWQTVWQQRAEAGVLCPPKRHSLRPGPRRRRRWLGCGRSSRPSTPSSTTPSDWTESARMTSVACRPAGRPRSRCIISASWCMHNAAGLGGLLRIC
jgi:hypothetical protein